MDGLSGVPWRALPQGEDGDPAVPDPALSVTIRCIGRGTLRHTPGDVSAANSVGATRLTLSAGDVFYNHMVVESPERAGQTDRLFFALSDATRRDIVTQALDRERSVSELGRLYPISLTAVQKHVEVLVDAGLVSKHRSGREQLVRGEVNQLRRAHTLLDELEAVWRARLERFEDVLNETTGKESE
jgi:DNA-binding transcriptional ArsR family regulator